MKNLIWIDTTKCICMLFVYWLHVGMFSSHPLSFPIQYGPFFVNAFFFISGYLLIKKHETNNTIDSRRRTLNNIFYKICIPSVIFSSIDFLPKSIIRNEPMSLGGYVTDVLLQGTQWFTCALAVAELLLLLTFCMMKRVTAMRIMSCSVILFIVGCTLQTKGITVCGNDYLPWFYKSGLMATLFLAMGGDFVA